MFRLNGYRSVCSVLVVVLILGVGTVTLWQSNNAFLLRIMDGTARPNSDDSSQVYSNSSDGQALLDVLISKGVYTASDWNGPNAPPYWDPALSHSSEFDGTNGATLTQWGPCYAPHEPIDWDAEISKYGNKNATVVAYPERVSTRGTNKGASDTDLAGYCRPGFLIIGAGKCGTSSLYHYLTEHPRVAAATEKQIHYFKYYYTRPMKWYLSFFASAASFLASGALMTGEASPGYLPYPEVANTLRQRMPNGPKIIAIGRNPLERAYSSYQYSYVTPMLENIRNGRYKAISRSETDEYYQAHYLFSFEEFMKAEMAHLRSCLDPITGSAITGSRTKYERMYATEYARRDLDPSLPPLADLADYCYGSKTKISPRPQFDALVISAPDKLLADKNVHLTESFIGRGLYVLPLEWWYAKYDAADIYFVCTEELSDSSGAPMHALATDFLGLPSTDFAAIVGKGAYNVGTNQGYDTETAWGGNPVETNTTAAAVAIPLSPELQKEFEEFVHPYNERLFALVGRRCNW